MVKVSFRVIHGNSDNCEAFRATVRQVALRLLQTVLIFYLLSPNADRHARDILFTVCFVCLSVRNIETIMAKEWAVTPRPLLR